MNTLASAISDSSRVLETYHPFPRQCEFHQSSAKYRLFGGAAGPGKTKALLWEAIVQALETPNVDTLLLRRTFPELESSLLAEFRRDVLPQFIDVPGFSFNESKHIARWPNGSTTRFGYCQNEKDVYQYQGAEYLFIGIDELTHFTLSQWQYLTSRNRCRHPKSFPNMAGASNPGNIGHKWVKALFIDRVPAPGMDRPEQYKPEEYDFIPATLDDNPLYADNASYLRTLDSLPDVLYLALRKGIWNIPAGQFFDVWNETTCAVHSSEIELRPWWPRWISADWGNVHPSAVYWHAIDGDTVYTYRELYGPRLGEDKIGAEIGRLSAEDKDAHGKPIPIKHFFLSPDAFADRTSQRTVAQQIGESLKESGLPDPARADDDRIGGARLMYQMLKNGYWKVFNDTCPHLVECIPTLLHDPKRLEDVLKVDCSSIDDVTGLLKATGSIGDDPYDAARYGLKSMLNAGKRPWDETYREQLSQVENPHSRAMLSLRLHADHAKERKNDGFVPGRLRWQRRTN